MPFDPAVLATLHALLDRLIPPDDFPGATEAGVDRYVIQQMNGDLADEREFLAGGLLSLETESHTRHACSFADLAASQQDGLLDEIARGVVKTDWPCPPEAWFYRFVELGAEGFYADPGQGGNRDEVSWKMIGYQRRPGEPRP